jgi:hypothetical protein
MYPVGAIYMTVNSSIPSIFGNMGKWASIGTIKIGSYTVYAIRRES